CFAEAIRNAGHQYRETLLGACACTFDCEKPQSQITDMEALIGNARTIKVQSNCHGVAIERLRHLLNVDSSRALLARRQVAENGQVGRSPQTNGIIAA